MTIRFETVVQHHPSRADILPRLLERVTDPIVVTDPGGEISNAWRSYRLCLRADVGDATHVVVIQDDALPCDHFEQAACAAIAAKPDAAIAFFLGGQPAVTALATTMAMKEREQWAEWSRRDWWPTVCAAYPVAMARHLADWVDLNKPASRGDDAPAGDFFRAHPSYEAVVTVPSLCQHPDDQPSLIGRTHMFGANPGRCARWMVEGDARAIVW